MTKFTFNNRPYYIQFVCSYGPVLSRSGKGAADYDIFSQDHKRIRFTTEFDLPKHGIERTGLAAIKRDMQSSMSFYAKKYGYKNRGDCRAAIS